MYLEDEQSCLISNTGNIFKKVSMISRYHVACNIQKKAVPGVLKAAMCLTF